MKADVKFIIVFLLFTACCIFSGWSQSQPIKFERIGPEQGLPQSSVNVIVQDSVGFLWLGTPDGLYKYDGYTFTALRHKATDSNTLSDNNILTLFMGSKNVMWIGTAGGGLNSYHLDENRITRYPVGIDNPKGISNITVRGIAEDKDGKIWVSTNRGINRLDPKTGDVKKYFHDPNNPHSLPTNDYRPIYYDKHNNIWIGTEDATGLVRISVSDETIVTYRVNEKDKYAIKSNSIRAFAENKFGSLFIGSDGGGLMTYDHILDRFSSVKFVSESSEKPNIGRILSLCPDSSGNLWIGTIGGGAAYYNISTDLVESHTNSPNNPASISNNRVAAILESRSKIMWFGTWGGGISKYSFQRERFSAIRNDPQNPNSLNENTIRTILQTDDNLIWLGTIGGGLNLYDRKAKKFHHYKNDPNNPHSLPLNDVSALYQIDQNTLLVGTWRGGLCVFDRLTNQFFTYKNIPEDSTSISDDRVQKIVRSKSGKFWIGTENGLNEFDLSTGKFKKYFSDPTANKGLSDNRIQTIVTDSKDNLWIGTWNGLNYFDTKSGKFLTIKSDPYKSEMLSNNSIVSLYQENDSILWIGTYGGGLNKLLVNASDIAKSYVTKTYTVENGLSANSIFGILEDDERNLWMSTTKGLSKFNKIHEEFRNYDVLDGLQSNEFYWGAYHKLKNGDMVFGGLNGFNIFTPSKIVDNLHIPNIVITSLKQFDREVPVTTALHHLTNIELFYPQNFFTIEFSALDYVNPVKNKYAYKLVGFNADWVHPGTDRSATYTNLSGGTYYFKIKGSNSDGIWNESGITLTITVHPPFWETWWFRLLGIVVITGGISLLYFFRIRVVEKQKMTLELQVKERTVELQQKKDQVELINEMVKSINREMNFEKVIGSILGEISKLESIDIAAAFIADKENHSYKLRGGVGFDKAEFENISLHKEMIEEFCLKHADEVMADLWLQKNPDTQLMTVKSFLPIRSLLTVPIRVESEIQGYFIFGNSSSDRSFSLSDIQLLGNLHEHLTAVFIKARILEELSVLNQKKNEFLGIAAHDLRSPLTVTINYLSLVSEHIKSGQFNSEKILHDLDKILTVTQNMSEMVSTLLDISAIESGKVMLNIKRERLIDILRENEAFYKRLAQQKNITLNYQINNKIQDVIIDRDRIVEVIDNLVSNAIKYTFPGGSIVIYSEDHGSEIVTHVQDNGQGLTKEDLTKVFKSYTKLSAKPTGGESSTGLGLAIVQKIVNLHGGRVWVVSEKEKGSKFSFSLPIANQN